MAMSRLFLPCPYHFWRDVFAHTHLGVNPIAAFLLSAPWARREVLVLGWPV